MIQAEALAIHVLNNRGLTWGIHLQANHRNHHKEACQHITQEEAKDEHHKHLDKQHHQAPDLKPHHQWGRE